MSKNTLLKAVLFDHDGTIVDSEGLNLEVWGGSAQAFWRDN